MELFCKKAFFKKIAVTEGGARASNAALRIRVSVNAPLVVRASNSVGIAQSANAVYERFVIYEAILSS